jgi:Na+/melibiose symporter-like transporter
MALIPDLSSCENERLSLNAIRYAFTVISNLFVYGVTFLFFRLNKAEDVDNDDLNRDDAPKFMYISFIVTGVGILFQIIFYYGTKEQIECDADLTKDDIEASTNPSEKSLNSIEISQTNQLCWLDYLKSSRFYMVYLKFQNLNIIL